jgi:predicted Zn-dependent protease
MIVFRHAIIAVIFLILASCAVNPVTGEQELMLISEQQEIQVGIRAAPSANWEFGGHYNDPALKAYLEGIVRSLWSVSERPNLPFQFYIQNSSVPNAFALPGYVAITRGLLCEMENEAQFAAVMGHEIGHVMARHTAQKISRATLQQLGLALGAAALGGGKNNDTLLRLGAVGSSLLLLSYDRRQELQADRLGVKYMAAIGYDPRQALKAHAVIEHAIDGYLARTGRSRQSDSFMSGLLSTHPRTGARLAEISAMIGALPPYVLKGDGVFRKRFLSATKSIRKVNSVYRIYDVAEKAYEDDDLATAEAKLHEAIRLDGRQAPFHNLLGFVRLKQKNYEAARKAFTSALSIDPAYQPSVYGAGLVHYFRQDYPEAIDRFKESLALFPDHAPSHLGLGKSYFRLKRYSKAAPHLAAFADAAPSHPEVHGLLGICYESMKDYRAAVMEYRNQLKVAPDTSLGRLARERLAVLEPRLRG